MTQLPLAKRTTPPPLVRRVAVLEGIKPFRLLELVRRGHAVIPCNATRTIKKPCAIGRGLRVKVNANIGTSTQRPSLKQEIIKLKAAVDAGADTVMDLSVGGDLSAMRREILRSSEVPVGTVPVYEVAVRSQKKYGDFLRFDFGDIRAVLEDQARQGVDFFTVHAGVTRKSVAALRAQRRLLGIVSRGGAILAAWMARHKKENPFYEFFDAVLDIACRFDVTLSLGDGLRPGSVIDATDKPQIAELAILGQLAKRCRRKNVQVMIEGPGHVPLDQIRRNIRLQKKLCDGAPFYVLGPLVTDVAPGYDHITSAIGGALAASYGADFLCYVTASEHLRHPTVDDVREGVVASRIAAHAADIARGLPRSIDWDRKISQARAARDWKKQIALSIDPRKARHFRLSSKPDVPDVCTMCGKYCSIKLMEQCVK